MIVHPERRQTVRRRVLKSARIVLGRLGTSVDCTVRNLSEAGACVTVLSAASVPNDFDLVLGEQPARRCRVIWRMGRGIGVSFC